MGYRQSHHFRYIAEEEPHHEKSYWILNLIFIKKKPLNPGLLFLAFGIHEVPSVA